LDQRFPYVVPERPYADRFSVLASIPTWVDPDTAGLRLGILSKIQTQPTNVRSPMKRAHDDSFYAFFCSYTIFRHRTDADPVDFSMNKGIEVLIGAR